jgi:hypothetical protein
MLVVTNYPNVPIATTNAATDAARIDNQQRPPVIPPQEMTKGHDERAFNPQHERTAQQAEVLARLNEKNQGKQKDTEQQQQAVKQHLQQAKSVEPLRINNLLKGKAALQRRDIRNQLPSIAVHAITDKHTRVQKSDINSTQSESKKETRSGMLGQAPEVYQKFGQHIETFYQQQTEPKVQPAVSALI